MEDLSSWTDNEDQEAAGEEEERTGSATVRGTVSEPLAASSARNAAFLKTWVTESEKSAAPSFLYFSQNMRETSEREMHFI